MADALAMIEVEIPGGLWHLDGVPVEIGSQKLRVHAPNEEAFRKLVLEKSGVKAGQLQSQISGSSPASIAELVEASVRKALADAASAASTKPDGKTAESKPAATR